MSQRELNFAANFVAGTNNEVSIILYYVSVSSAEGDVNADMGCMLTAFEQSLSNIGWSYDNDNMLLVNNLNPSQSVDVSELLSDYEDVVYFKGKPLQDTGFTDVDQLPIFEGHLYNGGVVVFNQEKGMWVVSSDEGRTQVALYTDLYKSIQGWSFPLTPEV